MAEFTVTVTHTTTGKEIVVAVEEAYTISSVIEVLSENLQLKDRFVLATPDQKVLNTDTTIAEAGLKQGAILLLMPDPTGG